MERVTLPEAARRLGVTDTTVRRRLRAGELQGEQEQTPQGYRWWIYLPEGSEATSGPTGAQVVTDNAALVVALQAQVTWLRERVEKAEREREEASREKVLILEALASEQEKNRILSTPQEPPSEPTRVGQQEPTEKPKRGRWWRRQGRG